MKKWECGLRGVIVFKYMIKENETRYLYQELLDGFAHWTMSITMMRLVLVEWFMVRMDA